MQQPELSVIIVNWNTRELLRRCLSSVYRYTSGIAYEVFVVDNHSSDGSPEMVEQEFPAVRLLRNDENLGFSKANNQAILLSTGRYIVLLNSDTELQDNALYAMAACMDQHAAVGILGTKLLNYDGTRQYSCDFFPRKPGVILWEKMLNVIQNHTRLSWQEQMSSRNFDEAFAVDYVIGAVLLIRRETIDDIGVLDERFFMYAEDIDWCYRAALAGWQTYYAGHIGIYHHNRGSSKVSADIAARLQTLRETNLLEFYKQHYGLPAFLMLHVIFFLKRLLKNTLAMVRNLRR